MAFVSPQRLAVIPLADVPLPGLPPSAIDAVVLDSTAPRRISKRQGYNCLEFALDPASLDSPTDSTGDYALYRYWTEFKCWRPEGPRGATPTTYDRSSVEGTVPIRISVPTAEGEYCVVVTSGGLKIDGVLVDAEIQEQQR